MQMISKCSFISFTGNRIKFEYEYKLNHCALNGVVVIKNLGELFNVKITFNIDVIVKILYKF